MQCKRNIKRMTEEPKGGYFKFPTRILKFNNTGKKDTKVAFFNILSKKNFIFK